MKEGEIKQSFGLGGILILLFISPIVLGVLALPFMLFWSGFKALFRFSILSAILDFAVSGAMVYGFYRLFLFLKNRRKKTGSLFARNKHVKETPDSVKLNTGNGEIIFNNPYRGFFVVGGAGSGKSESIAVPLLLQYINKGYSGIIYDFKFPSLGDEAENYINKLNRGDLRHFYLNFNNPLASHRVNPLNIKYMPNSSYAREYAQSLISNLMKSSIKKADFWSESATDLLTAVIWYLRVEHPSMCDLPHVCGLITSQDTALLKMLQTNTVTAQMTVSLNNALERGADAQLSGVVGSLQGAISKINTPEIMYIFGGNDFDLDINNPLDKKILTVGSHPSLTTTFAPLCSLVITVATKLMNQQNKAKSFILLDEAPTIYIPNFEQIPNTGRSNKISTVVMCQDLAQLTDNYGKEKADVLFSSCNNHFYGRVASSTTAEIFSKQFGKYDKVYTTQSRNSTGMQSSSGKSETLQEREKIKANQFLNFEVGEFAGIAVESNFKEFHSRFARPYRYEDAKGLELKEKRGDLYSYYNSVRADIDSLLRPFKEQKKVVKKEKNIYDIDF